MADARVEKAVQTPWISVSKVAGRRLRRCELVVDTWTGVGRRRPAVP